MLPLGPKAAEEPQKVERVESLLATDFLDISLRLLDFPIHGSMFPSDGFRHPALALLSYKKTGSFECCLKIIARDWLRARGETREPLISRVRHVDYFPMGKRTREAGISGKMRFAAPHVESCPGAKKKKNMKDAHHTEQD